VRGDLVFGGGVRFCAELRLGARPNVPGRHDGGAGISIHSFAVRSTVLGARGTDLPSSRARLFTARRFRQDLRLA